MALITIADSFSVKIANTALPAIAGDPEGVEKGYTAQTGLFVWVTDNVNVLGRATADTEWTVIENLGTTNKEAIIRWEDYDVVAFQSQTGNPASVRIIPKYGTLTKTTSNPIEVPRINKFSDLTDVPAYTAADEGKVFKVSGGGNLTLELPPNLNTQTSTFPHIGQLDPIISTVAGGEFEIIVDGDNFESSSKIYIYHEDATVHDYENRATADFSMYGDYTGHASLKTAADNITILETGLNNQILLSEFVEDANEFSGKIPFVFINKNKMRIKINPQTAGTYSMVVWNADGNKCVLKNCLTLT